MVVQAKILQCLGLLYRFSLSKGYVLFCMYIQDSLGLTFLGTPPFCSAKQVNEYLENYADHFNLRPHLRLNTVVKHVAREEESNRWRLDFELAPSEHFDKVVIATGPHLNPVMPEINGSSLFAGTILHSKSFKR